MNVYDFDGTIYDGDSTVDFYFYSLKKHISLIRFWPKQIWGFLLYFLKIKNKTQMKENFYVFLKGLKDVDQDIKDFWKTHECNIYDWYLKQKKDTDVIISASSVALLSPICKKLNVTLIASKIDKHTGIHDGLNCQGKEKVNRFKEIYKDAIINEFYSDSNSDLPMAKLAKKAYFVKHKKPNEWIIK